jgi:hypothetical protein
VPPTLFTDVRDDRRIADEVIQRGNVKAVWIKTA